MRRVSFSRLWLVFPILALSPLVIWFHLQSPQIRAWDETMYIARAQEFVATFMKTGFGAAFLGEYLGRDFAPMLHPMLIVPAILLTGGKVLLSAVITSAVFYTAFLLTIGIIFLEFVPPFEACLGTIVLGACPLVFGAGVTVMSEIYFLEFVALSLLFLIRSNNLSRPADSLLAGLFLGIAFCCRPVEPLTNLMLPAFWFLTVLFRGSRIGAGELIWLAFSAAATLGIPALSIRQGPDFAMWKVLVLYVLVQAAGTAIYFNRRKKRGQPSFFLFFATLQWIPFIYFLPVIYNLYGYVLDCTLGPLATFTNPADRFSITKFMSAVTRTNGILALAVLSAALVFSLSARKRIPNYVRVMFTGFLFSIALGSLTLNVDTRYYLAIFLLFLGSSLSFLLSAELPLRPLRALLVSVLAALQLWHLGAMLSPRPVSDPVGEYLGSPPSVFLQFRSYFPTRQALTRLVEVIHPDPQNPVKILVLQTWNASNPANSPITFNSAAMEEKLSLHFDSIWHDFPKLDQELKEIETYHPSYLLFEERNLSTLPSRPSSELAQLLLHQIQQGKISSPWAISLPWTKEDGSPSRLWLFKMPLPALRQLSKS